MSDVIDRRVVEMEFDNRDFEKNIKSSIESLEELKRSLDLEEAAEGGEKISETFDKIGRASDALIDRLSFFGKIKDKIQYSIINALAKVTNQAEGLIRDLTITPVMTGLQEYETQINSVQTILANTRDEMTKAGYSDAERLAIVNDRLDQLNAYADMTIYNFTQMTESIGKFTAAGVDLDTSVAAIQGIANLAAVSGSTADQANNAMYMLSQAISSGTVTLYHWNSVVRAGMGGEITQQALIRTAEALGKTVEVTDKSGKKVHKTISQLIEDAGSFRDSLSYGWLTSDILTTTLDQFSWNFEQIAKDSILDESTRETYLDKLIRMYLGVAEDSEEALENIEGYEDALARAEAVLGDASNLTVEGAKELKKAELLAQGYTTEQADEIIALAEEATDAATKVKTLTMLMDTLKEAAQSGWTQTWEYIIGDFEEAKTMFTGLSDYFGEIIGNSADARNEIVGAWHDLGGRDTLFNKDPEQGPLGAMWNLIYGISNIAGKLKETLGKLFPSITGEGLMKFTTGLQNATARFLEWTKVLTDSEGSMGFLSGLVSILSALWGGLKKVGTLIGKFFGPIFLKVFKTVGRWINTAGNAISKFLEKFTQSETFVNAWARISAAVSNASGVVVGKMTTMGETIRGWIGTMAEHVRESGFFQKAWEKIREIARTTGPKIVAFGIRVKEAFQGLFTGETSSRIGTVKEKLSEFAWTVGSKIGTATGRIREWVGAMAEHVRESGFFQKAWEKIREVVQRVGSKIAEFAMGAWARIKEIFSREDDDGRPFGQRLIESIKGWYERIKAALLGVWARVKAFFGGLFQRDEIDPAAGEKGGSSFLESLLKIFPKDMQNLLKAHEWGESILYLLNIFLKVKRLFTVGNFAKGINNFGKGFKALGKNGIFGKGKSSAETFKSVAESIKAIGIALGILVAAIFVLSKMNPEEIFRGIGYIAILLGELVAASLLVKGVEKNWKVFAALGFAVGVMTLSLVRLSKMDWGAMGKGLVGIGAILLEMALFTKISSSRDISGLIKTAIAVWLLTFSMTRIAQMPWGVIGKGLVGIGAILLEIGMFTQLVAEKKISGLIKTAIAVWLFSVTLGKIGSMDFGQILKGLFGIGAILAEVWIFTNLIQPKKMTGLLVTAIALYAFTVSMRRIGKMSWKSILKSIVTIGAILGAFTGMLLLTSGVKPTQELAAILGLFATLWTVLFVFQEIQGMNTQKMVEFAAAFALVMLSMSVALRILATIPVTGALTGLANFAIFIVGVGAIAAALGWLQSKWSNLGGYLDTGGNLMMAIGQALGKFIGGIGSGIVEGLDLPQMGTDLSDFVTNLQPFLEGVSKIDSTVSTGVANLCAALLAISGTELLNGLVTMFMSESPVTMFADDIYKLGVALVRYAGVVSLLRMVPDGVLEKSIAVAGALAGVAEKIPQDGLFMTLLRHMTGSGTPLATFASDIGTFGQNIQTLGVALGVYMRNIEGLDERDGEKALNFMSSFQAFVDELAPSGSIYDSLNRTFGEGSKIHTLLEYSETMAQLGTDLSTFSTAMAGVTDAETQVDYAATVLGVMQNFVDGLDKGGSLWDAFKDFFAGSKYETLRTASNAMATFGTGVGLLADGVAKAPQALKDFKSAKELGQAFKEYNDETTTWETWKYSDQLSVLMTTIEDYGKSLSIFATYLNELDMTKLGIAADIIGKIVEATHVAGETSDVGANHVQTILDSFSILTIPAFDTNGMEAAEAFSNSLCSALESWATVTAVVVAAKTLSEEGSQSLTGTVPRWFEGGRQLGRGLGNGITSMAQSVRNAAMSVAAGAIQSIQMVWSVHSPSLVGQELGMFFDMGIAGGLQAYAGAVSGSAESVASEAVDSAKTMLLGNNASIFDYIDPNPTIRPVVDLSGVQNGASVIQGMLGANELSPLGLFRGRQLSRSIGQLEFDGNTIAGGMTDRNIVSNLEALQGRVDELGEAIGSMRVVLDSGELVGATSYKMDGQLGVIGMRKGRGN